MHELRNSRYDGNALIWSLQRLGRHEGWNVAVTSGSGSFDMNLVHEYLDLIWVVCTGLILHTAQTASKASIAARLALQAANIPDFAALYGDALRT